MPRFLLLSRGTRVRTTNDLCGRRVVQHCRRHSEAVLVQICGPLAPAPVTRLPALVLGPNLGDEPQTLGGQGSEVGEVLVFAAFHPAGVCGLDQGRPQCVVLDRRQQTLVDRPQSTEPTFGRLVDRG
jgi:hypothetical protein